MTRANIQLMFQGERDAALSHWRRAFPELPTQDVGGGVLEVTVAGQKLRLFDSPPVHNFGFTPSFSLFIEVDAPGEVDRLAELLGEGGTVMMPLDSYDFAQRFAWVVDPFGISWQIICP